MAADGDARPSRFLIAYALANAGGVIAFLPLLTLLLPIKVEALAGDARLGVLTATALAGAVSASLSNILFGWLSDRSVARGRNRRGWITGGLIATIATYAAILAAASPLGVVMAIVAYQAMLNALLGPLTATMADEIPDTQKGIVGGLLALANPLASVVSALLVATAAASEGSRYAVVCGVVALLVTPLLASKSRFAPVPYRDEAGEEIARRDLAIAWAARLLVQVAGNVLFLYLLFFFESIEPTRGAAAIAPSVGNVLAVAFAVPLPIAVVVGWWSDRRRARKPFLLGAALVSAAGLVGMAAADDWTLAVLGFGLYAAGNSVFLGLHAALSMQLLPSPRHRGRDLGLLNLTNTLPALIGPVLAWWLATPGDFSVLLLVLAAMTAAGGLSVLAIRSRR